MLHLTEFNIINIVLTINIESNEEEEKSQREERLWKHLYSPLYCIVLRPPYIQGDYEDLF